MSSKAWNRPLVGTVFLLLLAPALTLAVDDIEIPNWHPPLYWQPPVRPTGSDDSSGRAHVREALAVLSSPLPFVAITPCRQYDSRSTTALPDNTPRTVTLSGAPCGIPTTAAAVAVNITIFNITGAGSNGVFRVGISAPPSTSWINYPFTETQRANAGVVGTTGAADIVVQVNQGAGSVDFVVDVFGYYSPAGIVNSVNALFGDVTLSPGSNVTITPSGQTLTFSSTGGAGGLLPSGTSGQTLRSNGTSWLAMSNLYNDGTNVGIGTTAPSEQLEITGNLRLPATTATAGQIRLGAGRFLHAFGTSNTFVGSNSGNLTMGGTGSQGAFNTAVGSTALPANTTGFLNTAAGVTTLFSNSAGAHNTAMGASALFLNQVGDENTAVGSACLNSSTGNDNTAIGKSALSVLSSGFNNVALGAYAGSANTSGANNVYISNSGVNLESNAIRIGTPGTQTSAVIAGISGATSAGGVAVLVNASGQLGTLLSSLRFKEDVRDMGDASADLMQLRPVTFRYKGRPDVHGEQHYGLIAEEVNEVLPELVARSADGEIETVKYHELPAMLLNELQKAVRRIEELEKEVAFLRGTRDGVR